MLKKLPLMVLAACISSTCCLPHALASNNNLNQRINYLQQQIDDLKQQQKQSTRRHSAHAHLPRQPKKQPKHTGRISMGPYLNQDQLINGSELIINLPSVREAGRLLLQQYNLTQHLKKLAMPQPALPRMVFSGKLEGLVSYGKTYAGSHLSNIAFSAAELDTYVQANPWVSGYMSLTYDSDELANGSRVYLNRAFITIGNLNYLPIYTSIGQIYVPFGRYASAMASTPVTQALGRTRARAINLVYQQTGNNRFHAILYGFQSLTNRINRAHTNNEWGADAGYIFNGNRRKVSGEIGASFIGSIADSQGMQATAFLHDKNLVHEVPAYALYAGLSVNPVTVLLEYIETVRHFERNDVNFANQGARPGAFHSELDFAFQSGSKPSSIGFAYEQTTQALAVGLPHYRYAVFYNVNIWKDTNFALEYRHDINYGASEATTRLADATPADVISDLGKNDDVITAQFDLFF